eukprot:1161903-Pelagomonas_calceolata.AAC.7
MLGYALMGLCFNGALNAAMLHKINRKALATNTCAFTYTHTSALHAVTVLVLELAQVDHLLASTARASAGGVSSAYVVFSLLFMSSGVGAVLLRGWQSKTAIRPVVLQSTLLTLQPTASVPWAAHALLAFLEARQSTIIRTVHMYPVVLALGANLAVRSGAARRNLKGRHKGGKKRRKTSQPKKAVCMKESALVSKCAGPAHRACKAIKAGCTLLWQDKAREAGCTHMWQDQARETRKALKMTGHTGQPRHGGQGLAG